MKKTIICLLTVIMLLSLSSCSLINKAIDEVNNPDSPTEARVTGLERGYIIYNGKTYYDIPPYANDAYAFTYKDYWTPLSQSMHKEKASFKTELGESSKSINVFDDKSLSMFIIYKDFNGEWLYCDQGYNLPDYLESEPEKIYISPDQWSDDENENKIVISDKAKIKSIMKDLRKANKYKKETSEISEDTVQGEKGYDIKLKFAGINAVYYYGELLKNKTGYEVYCQGPATDTANMPISEKSANYWLKG